MARPHDQERHTETSGSGENARTPFRPDWVIVGFGLSALLLIIGGGVIGSKLTGQAIWSTDPSIPAESRMWGHIIESSTQGVLFIFIGVLVGLAAAVIGYVRLRSRLATNRALSQHAAVMEELQLARNNHAADSAARGAQIDRLIELAQDIRRRLDETELRERRAIAVSEHTAAEVGKLTKAVAALDGRLSEQQDLAKDLEEDVAKIRIVQQQVVRAAGIKPSNVLRFRPPDEEQ